LRQCYGAFFIAVIVRVLVHQTNAEQHQVAAVQRLPNQLGS